MFVGSDPGLAQECKSGGMNVQVEASLGGERCADFDLLSDVTFCIWDRRLVVVE